MAHDVTPGRRVWRSGVLLSTLLALLALAACDRLGGGETIELDDGDVRLGGGGQAHEVRIRGSGGTDTLDPSAVTVATGDAVRFIQEDRRTHALAFESESLDPAARAFLESSMQLRGPPLVNEGSEWVVSLAEAPAGRYPFVCRTHGARGVLTVEAEE